MPQPYALEHLHLAPASEVVRLLAQFPDIVPESFGDGEYLVREAEPEGAVFLIVQGGLVVEQASPTPGTAPVQLALITAEPEACALIGEMAYLGSQARTASVRSCGRTHALRLEPRHIDGILEGYPGLTRLICRQFSQRLKATDQTLRTLQDRFALSPGQRLAQAGEILFTRGEPATRLYQLAAGSVRLEGPEGARELTAEDLPQGLLEPEAFLAGHPQRVTATVTGMAFLAVIDPGRRAALVRCFPDLVLGLLAPGGRS